MARERICPGGQKLGAEFDVRGWHRAVQGYLDLEALAEDENPKLPLRMDVGM